MHFLLYISCINVYYTRITVSAWLVCLEVPTQVSCTSKVGIMESPRKPRGSPCTYFCHGHGSLIEYYFKVFQPAPIQPVSVTPACSCNWLSSSPVSCSADHLHIIMLISIACATTATLLLLLGGLYFHHVLGACYFILFWGPIISSFFGLKMSSTVYKSTSPAPLPLRDRRGCARQ